MADPATSATPINIARRAFRAVIAILRIPRRERGRVDSFYICQTFGPGLAPGNGPIGAANIPQRCGKTAMTRPRPFWMETHHGDQTTDARPRPVPVEHGRLVRQPDRRDGLD